MNLRVAVLGAILAVLGLVFRVMLALLHAATFRSYLPPYLIASYAVTIVGAAIVVLGLVLRASEAERTAVPDAARWLALLSLANGAVAAAMVLVVLDPALEFPILLTRWPGIYMAIAYAFFVLVAVLGNAAWSALLPNLGGATRLASVYKWPLLAQLILTEAGSLGLFFMFLGGYVGAALDYEGVGYGIVGIAMEFTVVPSAISIFAIAAGVFVGLYNVLASLRTNGQRAAVTGPS